MISHIPFILLLMTFNPKGGVATISQEFPTQGDCELALVAALETFGERWTRAVCVSKEGTKRTK